MELKRDNVNLLSSIMNVDKEYVFNDIKDSSPILTQNSIFSGSNCFKDASSIINKNASINCLESNNDTLNKDLETGGSKFFDNSVIRNINSGLTRTSLAMNNENINTNGNNNLLSSLDSCNVNYFRDTQRDKELCITPNDFLDKDISKENSKENSGDSSKGNNNSNDSKKYIDIELQKETNILLNGINSSQSLKKIKGEGGNGTGSKTPNLVIGGGGGTIGLHPINKDSLKDIHSDKLKNPFFVLLILFSSEQLQAFLQMSLRRHPAYRKG